MASRIIRQLRKLLDVFGTPSNGQVPQWVAANNRFEFTNLPSLAIGSDSQLIYNHSGSLSGITSVTYTVATDTLNVGGLSVGNFLQLQANDIGTSPGMIYFDGSTFVADRDGNPLSILLSGDAMSPGDPLPAANVTGSHTLPDGVLSTNVALLNGKPAFIGTRSVSGDPLLRVLNGVAGASLLELQSYSDTNNGLFVSGKLFCQVAGSLFVFANESNATALFRAKQHTFGDATFPLTGSSTLTACQVTPQMSITGSGGWIGFDINPSTSGDTGSGAKKLQRWAIDGVEKAAIYKDAVLALAAQGSAPTARAGGLYYDGSHFYVCKDGSTWTLLS